MGETSPESAPVPARARVHARAGLLGNPSDGYGGRVIACTIADFAAEVDASPATAWRLETPTGAVEVAGFDDVADLVRRPGHDGAELLAAAVVQFASERADVSSLPMALRFRTSIPRQVGLSGSSAIVIGALRALGQVCGHRWGPVDLARAALAAEVDTLGWAAGPQDRVVQSHGGALDMDFGTAWEPAGYHRIDPARLPRFFLAWDRQGGDASDVAHSDVRRRYDAGDAEVVAAMGRFAELAERGRLAIDAGADERWPDLLDEAHALRSRFWHLRARDHRLVNAARSHGAGVAFAGSGGAVVGVLRDADALEATAGACADVGAGFIVPRVGEPHS